MNELLQALYPLALITSNVIGFVKARSAQVKDKRELLNAMAVDKAEVIASYLESQRRDKAQLIALLEVTKADLIQALSNKIDVADYKAKVSELHGIINALDKTQTAQAVELRHLKSFLRSHTKRRGTR